MLSTTFGETPERTRGRYDSADEFSYRDPMDESVTPGRGLRFLFSGGDARVVFRLSGTGVGGATIRVYHELYHATDFSMRATEAVAQLVLAARELSQIAEYTGRDAPTVIT